MEEKLLWPKFQKWLGDHPIKSALIISFLTSVVGGVAGGYLLRFIP